VRVGKSVIQMLQIQMLLRGHQLTVNANEFSVMLFCCRNDLILTSLESSFSYSGYMYNPWNLNEVNPLRNTNLT